MGRKALPLAPAAAAAAAAGPKRKGPCLPPLSACKRRRTRTPAAEQSGWASLPTDMARLVAWRVLAGDVVDYLAFRAVCSGWRACTPDLRRGNLSLRKPDFRPRRWVALCDGDAAPPEEAREVTFFHTRTARRLRVRLPELRSHRVVGFTDGLLVLLHNRTTAVRVLHPFTRDAIDLPPLAAAFRQWVKHPMCMLTMTAFVCDAAACRSYNRASLNHIAVVAHFRGMPVALFSQPGHPQWHAIRHGLDLKSILPFQGRLYATVRVSQRVVRVYPPDTSFMSYAPPADAAAATGIPRNSFDFLVESGGRMLLAMQHASGKNHPIYWQNFAYTIFEVDLHRRRLIPVRSLGDRALFLHDDRCLSVSATDLPSICGNSVYFSLPCNPTMLHSLADGVSDDLTASCQIHNTKERIRPSVRPFTIADHLRTYCHHDEWAKGLMFHEYHRVPESSFVELHKKMKRRDSRLRIPRTEAAGDTNKNLHLGSGILTAVHIPKQHAAPGNVIVWNRTSPRSESTNWRILVGSQPISIVFPCTVLRTSSKYLEYYVCIVSDHLHNTYVDVRLGDD